MLSETLTVDESAFVESLGAFLKHTRLQKGLTIEKASQATKIRSHFLACLENEDFSALPGTVYTIGFIRNYCDFLNVSSDPIVSLYLKQNAAIDGQSSFKIYLPNKPKKILTLRTIILSLLIIVSVSVIWYVLQAWQSVKENDDAMVGAAVSASRKSDDVLSETKRVAFEKVPQQIEKAPIEAAAVSDEGQNSEFGHQIQQGGAPVRDARFEKNYDVEPASMNTPIETIDSRLDAIGETWVKIMNEKGVRLKVKYLKKGESFSLVPYQNAYISVGDAEKVVYVQNTIKIPGSVYFDVARGFVENKRIKVLPLSDNSVVKNVEK